VDVAEQYIKLEVVCLPANSAPTSTSVTLQLLL